MEYVHPLQAVIPGVQGRLLSVLAETTAELSTRTLARLAGVSPSQASRVLGRLVDLGIVERRDIPPTSLFRFVQGHVVAEPLLAIARSRDVLMEAMTRVASDLRVAPASIIVFGSFATGEAAADSDIDAVVVRPVDVDASDTQWTDSVYYWRDSIQRISGNRVDVLEVGRSDVTELLKVGCGVWCDVDRDGIVVFGAPMDDLVVSVVG